MRILRLLLCLCLALSLIGPAQARVVQAESDATLTAGLLMADLHNVISGQVDALGGEGAPAHVIAHGLVGCAVAELQGADCGAGAVGGMVSAVYAGGIDRNGGLDEDQRAAATTNAEMIWAVTGYLVSGGKAENVSQAAAISQSAFRNNYLNYMQRERVEGLINGLKSCQLSQECSVDQFDRMVRELQLLQDQSTAQTVDMVAACIAGPSPQCQAHIDAADGFEEWAWSSPLNDGLSTVGFQPSSFQARAHGGNFGVDHDFNLDLIALDFARDVQSGRISPDDAADVFASRMQAQDGRIKIIAGAGQALSAGACYGTKITCVLGMLNAAVGLDRAYEGTVMAITGQDQLSAIETGLVNLAGYDAAQAAALRDDIETGVAIVTVAAGGGIVIYKGGQAVAQLRRLDNQPVLPPRGEAPNTAGAGSPNRETTGFSGRSGDELVQPNFQPSRNIPTTIGERNFSGHALDQMQNRGIPPSVVENTVDDAFLVGQGNRPNSLVYYDPTNRIRVVTKFNGDVVTVMPGNPPRPGALAPLGD